MAIVFDSDPRLLNYIQVGSSHCEGGVSAVSIQVIYYMAKNSTTLTQKHMRGLSDFDDDPGKIYV